MSKIYVTGLGPGAADQMTKKAEKVLEHCLVIIGYTVYIDLIREQFPEIAALVDNPPPIYTSAPDTPLISKLTAAEIVKQAMEAAEVK